jgi:hypothetical protein
LLNKDLHWFGFHTDHDFAYLSKLFTGAILPDTEKSFLDNVSLLFPNFYDLKLIADLSLGSFRGSLGSLSERLGVIRDDKFEHQAGSDSRLTSKCFFQIMKRDKNFVI